MNADRKALLVVDDEEFNRNLLVRQLNKEGYDNIETAGNGHQALQMARDGDFDLVLLDIEMPELDGHQVLEQLKSDMRLRSIPVVMISGVEEVDAIVKCIELGAEDFLAKPFNPVLLRARVGACLEKKRLADQERQFLKNIKEEKQRSEGLLNVILPAAAAAELKSTGTVKPRRYDNIAILFCDIVNFTQFCESHGPEEVVSRLQALFERYEELTTKYDMEKIKTIGDEFMSSAGLQQTNADPLLSAVKCGLEMAAAATELDDDWQVRVGVNCGPVVAGIVGRDKYQFDVWGDTVNMASRMAGAGSPGAVAMTYDAWMQVESDCEGRSLGRMDIKGKGSVEVIECTGVR